MCSHAPFEKFRSTKKEEARKGGGMKKGWKWSPANQFGWIFWKKLHTLGLIFTHSFSILIQNRSNRLTWLSLFLIWLFLSFIMKPTGVRKGHVNNSGTRSFWSQVYNDYICKCHRIQMSGNNSPVLVGGMSPGVSGVCLCVLRAVSSACAWTGAESNTISWLQGGPMSGNSPVLRSGIPPPMSGGGGQLSPGSGPQQQVLHAQICLWQRCTWISNHGGLQATLTRTSWSGYQC